MATLKEKFTFATSLKNKNKKRIKHSSRMHTARLPKVHASNASYLSVPVRGSQMNKFEQVSSDDHGGGGRAGSKGVPCPGDSTLYAEVQCIMGNGHIGIPCEQTDRQT